MKLKKNIAVSESGFVFDPGTGESFNLNDTGQLIVRLISENKKESEIMEIVMAKYDVDSQSLQRYMHDFTLLLRQYNLIEKEEV